MPDKAYCFVKYDIIANDLLAIQTAEMISNKPSSIVEYTADHRPDFMVLDVKQKLVKYINKYYARAVEDFLDKLYWTIIGSYTNMLPDIKTQVDNIESLVSKYVELPAKENQENELVTQLYSKISSHEEMILSDLIKGDRNLVYICQSGALGTYSILKYSTDFRIVCYEHFFNEESIDIED